MLILRATDLLTGPGLSVTAATSLAILLYVGHNVAATVGAVAGGHLIDRVSPRPVFAAAAALYVGAYTLFAVNVEAWPVLLVGFAAAGVGIGFAETTETTLVARLLPDELRGNGFGVLGLLQALGDLVSTVVVGILWTAVSPAAGFLYAAAWMLAAAVATLRSPATLRGLIPGRLTRRRPALTGPHTGVATRPACWSTARKPRAAALPRRPRCSTRDRGRLDGPAPGRPRLRRDAATSPSGNGWPRYSRRFSCSPRGRCRGRRQRPRSGLSYRSSGSSPRSWCSPTPATRRACPRRRRLPEAGQRGTPAATAGQLVFWSPRSAPRRSA
ncbi:MAG: MFS transporter [Trebonia sp.]